MYDDTRAKHCMHNSCHPVPMQFVAQHKARDETAKLEPYANRSIYCLLLVSEHNLLGKKGRVHTGASSKVRTFPSENPVDTWSTFEDDACPDTDL